MRLPLGQTMHPCQAGPLGLPSQAGRQETYIDWMPKVGWHLWVCFTFPLSDPVRLERSPLLQRKKTEAPVEASAFLSALGLCHREPETFLSPHL